METEKTARLLYLYRDFARGAKVRKQEAADRFGVTQRSLQRDIEDLRCFFAEQTPPGEIVCDAKERAYRLVERGTAHFTNGEVLAVCKILLESRSLRRDEMLPILDKLVSCCVPAEQRQAVEIAVKYDGYIQRQLRQVEEMRRLEDYPMPKDMDYRAITGLRLEARQKLEEIRPLNLGQASRVSGVSPADVAVLMVYLKTARSRRETEK